MRVSAAALTGVLLAAGMSGCSSRTESYCSNLKEDQPKLERLASSAEQAGGDVMADSVPVLEELRDRAPEDVTDEWDTFVLAWEGLADALHAAGAEPWSSASRAAVQQAARQLRSTKVVQSVQGIEQHARDVCKVDLGGSL